MQLFLNLNTRTWYATYVQAGSPTGWSTPEKLDRLEALRLLELGYVFQYTMYE